MHIDKALILLLVLNFSPTVNAFDFRNGVIVVKRGDNLSEISYELEITLEEIKTKCYPNHIEPPFTIYVGMKIDCTELIKLRKKVKLLLLVITHFSMILKGCKRNIILKSHK